MITKEHGFTFLDTYPLKRLGPVEKLLFFDIETTGFSRGHSLVYLIGCVFFRNHSWHLTQWFADTPKAEQQILETFVGFAEDFSVLIHFNGDRFDIPFLRKRCEVHGLSWDVSPFSSVDIYKRIQPCRKLLGLESLKQKSVESFLGISRQDTYSGGELIQVYNDYLTTREDALYDMLMLHNREDLEGMPLILPILSYPDFLEGDFTLEGQRLLNETTLDLTLKSPFCLPGDIGWHTSKGHFKAHGHMLFALLPVFEGTLKHFYPDYKDYYYLIYEDMAVHKSVGEYVDKTARKKATAKTCYTRQASPFILQPENLWSPFFQKEYRDPRQYIPYSPQLFEDPQNLEAYVSWLLERPVKAQDGR